MRPTYANLNRWSGELIALLGGLEHTLVAHSDVFQGDGRVHSCVFGIRGKNDRLGFSIGRVHDDGCIRDAGDRSHDSIRAMVLGIGYACHQDQDSDQ
jgi:hypothetical protein